MSDPRGFNPTGPGFLGQVVIAPGVLECCDGGGVAWGPEPENEFCPDCPEAVESYALTQSGLTNGLCGGCTGFSIATLEHTTDCTWVDVVSTFSGCGDVTITMVYAAGVMTVTFSFGAFVDAIYTRSGCPTTGGMTFDLTGGSQTLCGWPSTITITAIT